MSEGTQRRLAAIVSADVVGYSRLMAGVRRSYLKLLDVLANDERAVALVEAVGERNGNKLNERQVVVYDMANDKITKATFIYERPDVYDAFWDD